MKKDLKALQERLLSHAAALCPQRQLPANIAAAFLRIPRHRFVRRYESWHSHEWVDVEAGDEESHFAELYADEPILIYEGESAAWQPGVMLRSTISQPSLVLWMLTLLDLRPGHKVFELGTGSGWNAALMGELVGKQGKVVSVEMIAELLEGARAAVKELGLTQVELLLGDGGDGAPAFAPFDRAVFTAGANDLPRAFYQQVKEGGLLLFVHKNGGGGDTLLLLEKKPDHFASLSGLSCAFIPVVGKYQIPELQEQELEELLRERGLSPDSLKVRIYPIRAELQPSPDERLVRRRESQFLWSLPKAAGLKNAWGRR